MSASIIANKGFVAEFGTKVKAKKILRWLHRGVEDCNVDHQYHLLELNIEHEKALAIAQRKKSWTSISRGNDGRRTLTALWTHSA